MKRPRAIWWSEKICYRRRLRHGLRFIMPASPQENSLQVFSPQSFQGGHSFAAGVSSRSRGWRSCSSGRVFSLIGLVLMGLGSAPFYPTMIHEIPARFGARYSQSAVGLQIACAYIGSTFLPTVAGLLAKHFSLAIYPWFLLLLSVLMFFFSERITQIIKRRSNSNLI